MAVFFGKIRLETLDFGFAIPKGTSLRGTTSFDVFCVKIRARVSAVASQEPLPPKKKQPSQFVPRGAKSRMRRTETPKSIWIKFCMVVDIPDVVTYTNFGKTGYLIKGFLGGGGQISPSPIDFHRRPYNILALPCERVILPRVSTHLLYIRPCL